MESIKILVVEDEGVVAKDLRYKLQDMGYQVVGIASSGKQAIEQAEETRPDLVLMDIFLKGDMDGVDATAQIRSHCDIPVIYVTAYADDDLLQRAKITEPAGYILKPFKERELRTVIEIALYKHGMALKLQESERWLSAVLKSIGDAVIATDNEERILFMNSMAELLTGWQQEEAGGRKVVEVCAIVNETTPGYLENPISRSLKEKAQFSLTDHSLLIAKNSRTRPIKGSVAPIVDHYGNTTGAVLVFSDMTELRQKEATIQASLEEKKVMLKEIHHRVKNNLQVIAALLELQQDDKTGKEIKQAFKESCHRIRSMALIHESLYRSDNLARIEMKGYVQQLADRLWQSYGVDNAIIHLQMEGREVFLDLNRAVPCGLILNELLCNSLQHAFPEDREGIIQVSMQVNNDHFVFQVQDNGVGLPPDCDWHDPQTIGLEIVTLLVGQLNGSINIITSEGGTTIRVEF